MNIGIESIIFTNERYQFQYLRTIRTELHFTKQVTLFKQLIIEYFSLNFHSRTKC